MRVVLDANVWVSSLIAPWGVPGRIVGAARHGELIPVVSWEIATEVVDVLARPKLARYTVSDPDLAALFEWLEPELPRVDIEVEVRDPRDAPVVSAALSAAAHAIVTGDRHLLDDGALRAWLGERGVALYSPAELLERLG